MAVGLMFTVRKEAAGYSRVSTVRRSLEKIDVPRVPRVEFKRRLTGNQLSHCPGSHSLDDERNRAGHSLS